MMTNNQTSKCLISTIVVSPHSVLDERRKQNVPRPHYMTFWPNRSLDLTVYNYFSHSESLTADHVARVYLFANVHFIAPDSTPLLDIHIIQVI